MNTLRIKSLVLIGWILYLWSTKEQGQAQWGFTNETAGRFPSATERIVWRSVGDVDSDGDVDVHVVVGVRDKLWINQGNGFFEMDSVNAIPEFSDAEKVSTGFSAFGDLNRDGHVDMVLARIANIREEEPPGGQNRILMNNGQNIFLDETSSRLPPYIDNTVSVYLWDVDYDGHLDIFVCNEKNLKFPDRKQNRLYINDGNGFFTDETEARLPFDRAHGFRADTADVDGDGDFDIYVSNVSGFQDYLWLNDGEGFFTDATTERLPQEESHTWRGTFGDIDNDGDPDVVASSENGVDAMVLINDGTGFFTEERDERLPYTGKLSGGLYNAPFTDLGDVDLDGDLDLLFSGFRNIHFFLNDGKGFFMDVTDVFIPSELSLSNSIDTGLLMDVDNDGDLDLFLQWASPGGEVDLRFWSNTIITTVNNKLSRRDDSRTLNIFPNPFNEEARITYSLLHQGYVRVEIIDVRGRLVKRLRSEFQQSGLHEILWDGKASNGQTVASGVYLVTIFHRQGQISRRILVLK